MGTGTEGLAEGPLLGDERTLTECKATSQFDPSETLSLIIRDDEPTIANSWQNNERDDD